MGRILRECGKSFSSESDNTAVSLLWVESSGPDCVSSDPSSWRVFSD